VVKWERGWRIWRSGRSVRVSSTGDEKRIGQAHQEHGSIGGKFFILF